MFIPGAVYRRGLQTCGTLDTLSFTFVETTRSEMRVRFYCWNREMRVRFWERNSIISAKLLINENFSNLPVMIQALVVTAHLIKPLVNASFSFGFNWKLLAPPVTDMTRFGMSNSQVSMSSLISLDASVSCDIRMYYK